MKEFIAFVVENWYIFIAFIAVLTCIIITINTFVKMPTGEKVAKVKVWMQKAVQKAETSLGSGAGQKKLRRVYKRFILRFPIFAILIDYELFKHLVDEALDKIDTTLTK